MSSAGGLRLRCPVARCHRQCGSMRRSSNAAIRRRSNDSTRHKEILNLSVALAPAMSIRAISGFEELGCPRFTCAMGVWPYASFTDTDGPGANDRWTYIRDSILPIWTGMNVDQRTEWVKKRLDIIRNSQEARYDGF